MAVSRATSWTDTTAVVASSSGAILKTVRATLNPSAAAVSYIQIYDAAATPGTTAPDFVFKLEVPLNSGNKTRTFPIPGGFRCTTALNWFVSTTHDGGTAASTSAPLAVDVHYGLGG